MAHIKHKNLIITTVSLIIILIISFLIIRPTIDYIINTKEQIKIEREDLEKQYQRIIYLRKNAEKVKEIEQQLVVLDDLFLLTGQELKFITTLESVAEKNNVSQKISLKSVNMNNSKQTALPFIISANGNSYNIISFLLEIEQLPYYINFNSLKISSKSADKNIEIILNGEIYLF